MFSLREIKSRKEIEYCVRSMIDWADSTFIPINEDTARANLSNHQSNGSYLKLILRDGEVVGWILANPCLVAQYSNLKAFRQEYYYCSLEGYSAVKALLFTHDELEKEAIRRRLPLVHSSCSHFDESHQFCRILKKHGWNVRGYIAIKKLSYD